MTWLRISPRGNRTLAAELLLQGTRKMPERGWFVLQASWPRPFLAGGQSGSQPRELDLSRSSRQVAFQVTSQGQPLAWPDQRGLGGWLARPLLGCPPACRGWRVSLGLPRGAGSRHGAHLLSP